MIRHAGLVALRLEGDWQGALIEGPSGSGKSDLALRCLEAGFSLVADDQTLVWACEGALWGRAPDTLHGLMEARGVGICAEPALPFARITLLVRLVAHPDQPERLPDPHLEPIHGVAVSALDLWPLEPSAPAKLRRALCRIGQARQGAYLAPLAAKPLP